MKKLLLVFLLSTTLFLPCSQKTFSFCDCRCFPGICPGDIVEDVTLWGIQEGYEAIDIAKQAAKYVSEYSTAINTYTTQINTYKTMWDQTIGRPLKDAMTLMAIAKDSEQILNLVNGSTGGNSLLVADPEEYIKNKGLNSLRSSYNTVEAGKGLYSEGILNNIVATARNSVDTTSLNQSSVPSTIQNDMCDDTTLSEIAEDEISEGGTIDYTEEEYKEEKDFLYNELCVGDPTTDKATADKLLAVGKQKPSLGMWDNWLATTGGDNEYTRKTKKAIATEQQIQDKKASALQDMKSGGGIKSATICVEYDEKMQCTKEEVINPSKAISEAFAKAKTAGLDTAISTFGTGGDGGSFLSDIGGILSLAGDAYNAVGQVMSVVNDVNGVIGQVTGTINGIEGSINNLTGTIDQLTGQPITSGRNDSVLTARRTALRSTNSGVVTNKSYAPDLANDADRKATLLLPIQRILNAHLSTVNDLTKIDNDYISEINYYKGLVEGVKTCYANVESYARSYATSTPYANYSTPQSVLDFYTREMQISNNLIATLTNERDTTVPQAKSVIQDTLTKVNTSNSSDEIIDLTNRYNNTVDGNGLPTVNSNGVRSGEYQIYKSGVENKLMEQGIIGSQNTACTSALDTVKAAITERDRPVYNYGGVW